MSSQNKIQTAILPIPDLRSPQGVFIAALIAVLALAAIGTAHAEPFHSRADKWEFTVQMPYVDQQSMTFDGGSKVDTNSDVGFGFGFGYNYSDHLALILDINWASPTYDATIASSTIPGATFHANGTMYTSSTQLNLHYNFLTGAVTPFVSGGLGWMYIDTNIASAPPSSGCYWDPWYGNICTTYQPTYSDWRFAYNAVVGVRWDMSQTMFLRGSLGKRWVDLPNSGTQDFTTTRIELGFSY